MLQLFAPIVVPYLFAISSKEERILLNKIIKDTDLRFFKWAIPQILNWKNEQPIESLMHIHGTHDRIFPIKSINGALQIYGGGHFMIVNKAKEICRLILQ